MILFTWLCLSTPIKKAHCMHAVGGGRKRPRGVPTRLRLLIHTRVSRKRQFDNKKGQKIRFEFNCVWGRKKGGGKKEFKKFQFAVPYSPIPPPLTPAFCFLEIRLLFTLFPFPLKSFKKGKIFFGGEREFLNKENISAANWSDPPLPRSN